MRMTLSKFLVWASIGGMSLFAWPIMVLTDTAQLAATPTLLLLLSFPHFVLSLILFYTQKDLVQRSRLVSYALPVALLFSIAVLMSFESLRSFAAHVALAMLFHHIATQANGVALYYSPDRDDRVWRRSLSINAWTWALAGFCFQESMPGRFPIFKTYVEGLFANSSTIVHACFGLALASFAICLFVWYRKFRKQGFKTAAFTLTPLFALAVWYIPAFMLAGAGLVAVFHALQYAPFAAQKLASRSKTLKVAALVFSLVGGAVAFDVFPRFISVHAVTGASSWISALFIYLNVHHFIVERSLWSRRRGGVAVETPLVPAESAARAA